MLRSYCYLLAMLCVSLSVILAVAAIVAGPATHAKAALIIISVGCWPLVFGFVYLAALTPRTTDRHGADRFRRRF